jgi:threonine synthase
MARKMEGIKVKDQEIQETIREVYHQYHYILDPHTAVGIKALDHYRKIHLEKTKAVVLGTAHPAKFPEIVERELEMALDLPPQLKSLLGRHENFENMEPIFQDFKHYLMEKVLFL